MVGVGIFTLGGNFELLIDAISYIFDEFMTVVSPILLYRMYGGWSVYCYKPL